MPLEVRNVDFRAGRKSLLRDISAEFAAGRLSALAGPNGAGKTSLLHVLAGWLRPQCGEVLLDGVGVNDWGFARLALRRAVLTQHDELNVPFTVCEVIEMAALPFAAVSKRLAPLTGGLLRQFELEALRERVYLSLSGGERQRVRIARAVLQVLLSRSSSRYLLLDEPLNELDIVHRHRVMRYLRSLAAGGIGVVAVLHDLNAVRRYADDVCLLKDGRMTVAGKAAEVLTAAAVERVFEVAVGSFDTPIAPVFVVKD